MPVRVLRVPIAYSLVYFEAIVVYFTYAADVLESSDLPTGAVPVLYIVMGTTGMVAVMTGTLAQRLGSVRVAALCLVAAALALLGLASDSVPAVTASACVFGMGYMTGSAALAVWTAEVLPDRAGTAFTVCLVVGAVASVAAPAVAGALLPAVGMTMLLVFTGVVSLGSGVALLLAPPCRRVDVIAREGRRADTSTRRRGGAPLSRPAAPCAAAGS